MTIRLLPDQMRRLERVAHHRRQTKQHFVQEVVMTEVTQAEEAQRLKKLPPFGEGAKRTDSKDTDVGLGIATRLQPRPTPSEPITVAPTAPVVVQVGNTPASTNGTAPIGDLDRLAVYVVKGDDFMRDMRKRTTLDILRASATTDEEYNVLVAQLEQIVAIKTKAVEANAPVNRLARFAFDKLTSLLRGD